MSFQTPITIAEAIKRIENNQFLLPAIQREFVWPSDKIEWLFDSIMKGYPISSFLFWNVKEETAQGYQFYTFIKKYRERYATHNEEISTDGAGSFYAVLDGQQRLTSLYLGLKGSYAYKGYRKKWENTEESIPTRHLYLNISRKLTDQEDSREYEFSFQAKNVTEGKELYIEKSDTEFPTTWFKVGAILNYTDEEKFDNFVETFESKYSRTALRQLRRVILEKPIINYFLEEEQDLHKALNIFIRINSGGEPLNFSDLIMSIAIANWERKDARKEIHSLVDSIQEKGFSISKDLILKTFLYLHSKDIKFKVTNFSKENAKDFETYWEKICAAISVTFDLLRSFGFSEYNLTSKNAVIPIIYYLYHKNIYQGFVEKKKYEKDRAIIKKWLHSVLIKRVFGASSDTILSQIRQAFTDDVLIQPLREELESFPTDFKALRNFNIDDEFIEELLWTQIEDKYAFSILSLLYPNLDFKNNNFHKDHLHPIVQFSKLSRKDKNEYTWYDYNSIYNAQLLDANENMSKNDLSLAEWVNNQTNKSNRKKFLMDHIIPDVDLAITNFSEFFEKRKTLLIGKLKELLN